MPGIFGFQVESSAFVRDHLFATHKLAEGRAIKRCSPVITYSNKTSISQPCNATSVLEQYAVRRTSDSFRSFDYFSASFFIVLRAKQTQMGSPVNEVAPHMAICRPGFQRLGISGMDNHLLHWQEWRTLQNYPGSPLRTGHGIIKDWVPTKWHKRFFMLRGSIGIEGVDTCAPVESAKRPFPVYCTIAESDQSSEKLTTYQLEIRHLL